MMNTIISKDKNYEKFVTTTKILSLSRKDLRELASSLCSFWCEDTVRSGHLPTKKQFGLLNSGS